MTCPRHWFIVLALATPANAQDEPAQQPEGLLPVPDYSGGARSRASFTGDWNGARSDWAQAGLTFELQWTQFAQGVVSGGLDTGWEFPGSLDTVLRYDGLRAGTWPALFTLRVESRYGDNVNGNTGLLLPSNVDVGMPLTDPPDEDILATITELNVVQPLSSTVAVLLGKVQTFDSDPSEFASGRGRHQFFQFPMVANAVAALTVPYSTLATGVLWFAGPRTTLSSTLMNTADSSTTSGFDDVGDGTTWATELQHQYRWGELPGGQNVGVIYAFDADFRNLNGRLQVAPGGVTTERESTSWAAYWTAWQYVHTESQAPDVIQAGDGRPDLEGLGVFARLGVADNDTNPIGAAASVGLGGRGLVDGRDDDSWGLGFFYNALHEPRTTVLNALEDHAGGAEGFYVFRITPAIDVTVDVQWLQSAFDDVDEALVLGLRLNASL